MADPTDGSAVAAAVDDFVRRHQLDEDARAALSTLFASYSTLGDAPTPTPIEVAADPVGDRYEDLGLIGRGGQGEVRRVRDYKLGRELAMKILRPMPSARARARFRLETAITVALQHPGIVPVYDRGITGDGRPWYTMKIIEGRELFECITVTHRETDPSWTLRRLVDAFARVCEAVAYAHEKGVVHRDLKPQNIMVGRFGEVIVMDWGLARWLDDAPEAQPPGLVGHGTGALGEPGGGDGQLTRAGAVMGTPSFMAPEQARGELDRIGPRTDVFALGGILHAILTGEPARQGRLDELRDVIATEPPPAPRVGPPPLRALCRAAMAFDAADRPPHAGVLAVEVRRWLDGARRRAEAREVLAAGLRLEPEAARLREEAERLEAQAAALLDPLPPDAPVEEKKTGWQLEDTAADRRRAARITELKTWQMFQTAVELDPDFSEARRRITDYYRGQVLDGEARHDAARATEYAALLEGHDREGNIEWLRGDGRLTLLTDPPGAEVRIHRYESRDRVLMPVPMPSPAPLVTPLVEHPLGMGSYLLTLHAPGRAVVRYPVMIERLGHWDGVPPGELMAYAIPLPREDEIGAGECYVPAGWFVGGGDAEAVDGLPRSRTWVDGFVIGRCSVSNAEYIEFLDALLAEHGPDEAERWVAREEGRPMFVREGERHAIGEGYGYAGHPELPALRISVETAMRHAEWRRARSGLAWRLPTSWQWEKAARGVDGRPFPWGAYFDVTRAAVMYSRSGLATPVPVGTHPFDESPFGVRDMAGNARNLCSDLYRRQGPLLVDGRFCLPAEADATTKSESAFRVVKGGMYHATAPHCRLASRFGMPSGVALSSVGFRLCRPWG